MPALRDADICVLHYDELSSEEVKKVDQLFEERVYPVLTPLAVDPAHPFPQLLNKSLNLIVHLEMPKNGAPHKHLAVVQCPAILPRLIQLPRDDGGDQEAFLVVGMGGHVGISQSSLEEARNGHAAVLPA